MPKKRNRLKGRLSSKSVLMILVVNILVMAAVFVFFGWLLNMEELASARREIKGFTFREAGLSLVLSCIINGMLDYKWVIKPLWELEESIQKYRENEKCSTWAKTLDVSDISIDETLNKLMQQQSLIYERERIEGKERQKTELYALQSQINPHFLYNALDSIRGYAMLHDMEEISEITEALSRVFRNMISDRHELLPLKQEMDNISNYMKIQQFRFNNKFDYACEVDEELLNKYMVPRMVLQPLVENAIMHGLEKKIEGGWVRVTAYVTERRFVLDVIDNGAGIKEERLELLNQAMKLNPIEYSNVSEDYRHTGIALININRRIKLNFGNQYGIILNSTPDVRTVTEVVLPLLLNRK